MDTQETITLLQEWMDEALAVKDYQRYMRMHYLCLMILDSSNN